MKVRARAEGRAAPCPNQPKSERGNGTKQNKVDQSKDAQRDGNYREIALSVMRYL